MTIVLIVVAHADDEVLGCGGTIAKHVAAGDQVSVVIMTDGVLSRILSGKSDQDERENATFNAMKILGVGNFYQLMFPDNQMDSVSLLSITQALENIISDIAPAVVYTHFAHDLNIDHRLTLKAVMIACRPQITSSVKKILSFEVLSSTEWNSSSSFTFIPQYVVNISSFWEKKLAALKCYDLEMRDYPHSRSYECVEALAVLRGASNGFNKAEAFFVERILES